MNKLTIENLPNIVMAEVRSTLTAYDRVNVVRENGEYKVMTGIMLKKSYASDYASLEITKDEIFSEKEQMLNYINTFRTFPIRYTGERDYNMLNILDGFSYDDEKCPVVKMDENGNFYI